uniref:Uncharacterized protein n=1 Tax=Ixodes ricinus TaxID=34613 RepID=A0A6B0U9F6_IXORI
MRKFYFLFLLCFRSRGPRGQTWRIRFLARQSFDRRPNRRIVCVARRRQRRPNHAAAPDGSWGQLLPALVGPRSHREVPRSRSNVSIL